MSIDIEAFLASEAYEMVRTRIEQRSDLESPVPCPVHTVWSHSPPLYMGTRKRDSTFLGGNGNERMHSCVPASGCVEHSVMQVHPISFKKNDSL